MSASDPPMHSSGHEHEPVAAIAASERSELARSHLRASLGGKIAEFVPLALLLTVVPRVLGPDDYGRFAFAWLLVTLASAVLTADGIWLMSRFVPAASPDRREALARALAVRLARRLAVASGGVAIVVGVVVLTVPYSAAAALLIGAALVADLFATLCYQAAIGLGRVGVWSFRFALQNAILVVAAVALHDVAGATGAVAAVTISSAAAGLVAAVAVLRRLRRAEPGTVVPGGAERFAVEHGLSDVMEHVAYRGGVVAVAILSDSPAEVGYAAVALGIATAVLYTVKQVFAAQLVGITALWRGDPASTLATVRVLAERGAAALAVVAVVGAVVREPLLVAVLQEDFRDASAALVPVLALLPLAPLAPVVGQTAALHIKARERLWAASAGTGTFLVVAVLAIPRWGAVGGTSALLTAVLATIAGAVVLMREALPARLLATGLAGAAAVLLAAWAA